MTIIILVNGLEHRFKVSMRGVGVSNPLRQPDKGRHMRRSPECFDELCASYVTPMVEIKQRKRFLCVELLLSCSTRSTCCCRCCWGGGG
jgi:hypothetical protein